MKKIIFIVIDGLGDRPIPELGNRTPLDAAKTPNLDWLAKNGICGLVEPFEFGWQRYPDSDTAHLALFGYEPEKYYLGRGVYEAAGIKFKLKKGDVALRTNFATVDSRLVVIHRRAGRIKNTRPLVNRLSQIKIKGVRILVRKSYGHRLVLVLRPLIRWLSAKISDSDPGKDGEKVKKVIPLDTSKEAKFTADVLNKFLFISHQILDNHPLNKKRLKQGLLAANYLLTRGAGEFKPIPSFNEKYGLKACCIAGGKLYKGIGRILGMNELFVKGANGFADTNLRGKFSAAKKALGKYDFIFLHIKAADSLSEDGNFLGKREFIERIDENIKPLRNLKNTLILVTGDHSTCCGLKRHCNEPLPILIFGLSAFASAFVKTTADKKASAAKPDGVLTKAGDGKNGVGKFSEGDCRKGGLGKIKGLELMPKLLKLAEN